MPSSRLRSIPAVEKVLQALGCTGLPRAVVVAHVRQEMAALRKLPKIPAPEVILEQIRQSLAVLRQSRIQPLINGTGILIHTNLGRAPLAPAAKEALVSAAGYTNLEFDLATGSRGSRGAYLERALALLCGAQAATVVNNCAAALVLILRHFAKPPREEVVISRGELVQIGGGFRIPEILEASGARLREVGTTNQTTIGDYSRALGSQTALILKVHRSNFFMGGFVESPSTPDLAALARKKRIPFVEDLGSGAMVETETFAGLEHEPTPAETLNGGVDLVCCSGDKLLGGPQAGVIAGKARWVAALKREPFFRALRCDKFILSALQATVDLYLEGCAEASVPALRMLGTSLPDLHERAGRILAAIRDLPLNAQLGRGQAQVGGGTLPRARIASVSIDLRPRQLSLEEFSSRLRQGTPPVVGFVSGGMVKVDLRTVFAEQDELLVRRLGEVCRG